MAEILKITTPIVNKNTNAAPPRPVADPNVPLNLQDVQTVTRPATQQEILQQNNGLLDKETSSSLLAGLLKDPAAAVSFLKNITILQELVKLLPANNTTVTQEIEQLFNALLIHPEEIAAEMMNQESTSTSFRGELFNFLRGLVSQTSSPEVNMGVAGLLKAINSFNGRKDALNAVANSLQFLAGKLAPSKGVSEQLIELAKRFRQADAGANFPSLKREALDLLKELEGNLLFSPKMAKISAITTYNLSRFNDNPDFFQESASNLFLLLDGAQRKTLQDIMGRFRGSLGRRGKTQESKIMDVLIEIIGKQAGERELSATASAKIEKIIYSLLSSPCHFTPLLHFVIPVEYESLKSFAEIWVNPHGEEDLRGEHEEAEQCIHLLLAFDIEGIGQFEAELYTFDQRLELFLYCPAAYSEIFSARAEQFEACLSHSDYRMSRLKIERLEKPRSLMEVFKSLPYKRTGVNVKV